MTHPSDSPSPAARPPMDRPAAGRTDADRPDTTWAVIAHVSQFCTFVGVPGFAGPLLVWLLRRQDDPFAADQAKEALNFSLSLLIYTVALFLLLAFALFDFSGATVAAVVLSLAFLALASLVFPVIAALKAGAGERYRYPLTLRLF